MLRLAVDKTIHGLGAYGIYEHTSTMQTRVKMKSIADLRGGRVSTIGFLCSHLAVNSHIRFCRRTYTSSPTWQLVRWPSLVFAIMLSTQKQLCLGDLLGQTAASDAGNRTEVAGMARHIRTRIII